MKLKSPDATVRAFILQLSFKESPSHLKLVVICSYQFRYLFTNVLIGKAVTLCSVERSLGYNSLTEVNLDCDTFDYNYLNHSLLVP